VEVVESIQSARAKMLALEINPVEHDYLLACLGHYATEEWREVLASRMRHRGRYVRPQVERLGRVLCRLSHPNSLPPGTTGR
jgi:hypothetical protein